MTREDLRSQLSCSECAVVEPFLSGAGLALSSAILDVEARSGFLLCKVWNSGYRCCPFEFSFGIGEHEGRFNLFFGNGVGFANYEACREDADVAGLAGDLRTFLVLPIWFRRDFRGGGLVRETLKSDLVVISGVKVPLVFSPPVGFFAFLHRKTYEEGVYEPWISSEQDFD